MEDLEKVVINKNTKLNSNERSNEVVLPNYKSTLYLGNIAICVDKKFNKLQKMMWKILLGIKIIDID